jgi:ATP-dependent Clp protease ATP-binding subunit ClpC
MFERFTERARQVVVLAQDEARALRHDYIGTEHLLLGLLREEEGLGARVLGQLDVEIESVRAAIRSRVGEGVEPPSSQIPFTPHAKQTLELSLREALSLGHKYIGTEHLLLGFVRQGEGVGVEILEELVGASPAVVREEVIQMLSGPGRQQQGGTVQAVRAQQPLPRVRVLPPTAMLVTGWVLFAAALGVGMLIGWAIWG